MAQFGKRCEEGNLATSLTLLHVFHLVGGHMMPPRASAAVRCDNIQKRWNTKGSSLLMAENVWKGRKRTLRQS